MGERDLWLRYHLHDPTALPALWEIHEPSLRRQADGINRYDRHQTDDDLQDLYVKLHDPKKQDAYNPEFPWRPWAGTILYRDQVSRIRRDRIRKKNIATGVDPNTLQGDYPTSEEEFDQKEFAREKAQCESKLTEPEKTAYLLRKTGMKLEDIAADTRVSVTQVHRRIGRARQEIAGCLERKGYDGGISHET